MSTTVRANSIIVNQLDAFIYIFTYTETILQQFFFYLSNSTPQH